jgi:hypothetical protein
MYPITQYSLLIWTLTTTVTLFPVLYLDQHSLHVLLVSRRYNNMQSELTLSPVRPSLSPVTPPPPRRTRALSVSHLSVSHLINRAKLHSNRPSEKSSATVIPPTVSQLTYSSGRRQDKKAQPPHQTQRQHSLSWFWYLLTLFSALFQWVRGDLIGKGSFGRVYLAIIVATGEIMAVKQVEISRAERANGKHQALLDSFKLESDTLKELEHPNIVQYLGFEEAPTFMNMYVSPDTSL